MEEVKSAKVNKNLNTGHKRPSKFMIFDKQKSSDIKFYGNQNSKEYSKSKASIENQNNTSECSSDCIRVIDDSESSISCLESDRELLRLLKIKSPTGHKYQSNLGSNYNQNRISEKEMHILREIKAQQLLLQYLKCKNALTIGLMNLTYTIFNDFRVPQSGQYEKARFAIMIDESNIACVEDIMQRNIEMIDENPMKNKLSSVSSCNKCPIKSQQYNKKRIKRKAISDLVSSVFQKNSIKRNGIELPPRCRNINPQTNQKSKGMANDNTRHQSSSSLQRFSPIRKLRDRKQKQSFLPNILCLKSRSKQSEKVSSTQTSLRSFHKFSLTSIKTNTGSGILNKAVTIDGQPNFSISTKHNPRGYIHSKGKSQIGGQQIANLRSNSRSSVKPKSRNQLILLNSYSQSTLISAMHANKNFKELQE